VLEHGRGGFQNTRWSLVLRAGTQPSKAADDALAALCEMYWYPLYAFLRRRGHSAEDAKDLTQAFFVRLLEKQVLSQADPGRGRFRSFLLASLKNFVANERDRETAKKRGGDAPILPLEFETAEGRFVLEPPTQETPEKVFDRQWAMTLLDRAMKRLTDEQIARGKQHRFERLKAYIAGEDGLPGYRTTGQELGISEGAARTEVSRLRDRFGDLVRDEIAETIGAPGENRDAINAQIDDEIRYLWSILKSGRHTVQPLP
jgi:RNA polymerase sigma factor (sigma-70 family)